MSIFKLTNVGYTYSGPIEALKEVTLGIEPGEQIAILGANGSGKSTLLKLLAGLILPSTGEVRAFDHVLTEKLLNGVGGGAFAQMFRSKVGLVFQNSDAQLFCPTVFDEIAFGLLQLDLPRDAVRQRVEEVMEMLGIQHLRNRAPYALSGGEKKRVAIASVLPVNPDVLLLDEPTSGLDPRTQSWFEDLLHDLGKAGKTIVLATQDLDIVDAVSNRAVIFGEDHRIAADGETDAILDDHTLLLQVNLIHEHYHHHGDTWHKHWRDQPHQHSHNENEVSN